MTNEKYKAVYDHALEIAAKTGFTEAQIAEIAPVMELVLEKAPDAFAQLENAVLEGRDNGDMLYALTRPLGVEDDPGMLAVCLLLTHVSHRYYREKGIAEDIYLDSMRDIWVWTQTCLENRHHLGLYQYGWIRNFYRADIVRLGRLEFHIVKYHHDEPYTACGVTVQKGDPVINTHIPADGHMDPEAVQEAFRRACRYFGRTGITPIVCDSWLLYPKNRLFCKPDSRMVAFLDNFTILESKDIPDSGDLWRVFGHRSTYEPDTLPDDTPLRRQLKEHLKNGGTMGTGYGIFLHDGERRVDEPEAKK
ncbi:MAG: DUF5596 domain-containing protein [Clostridia bacterium]|nr:DUF5596 domain-containing protein [Clostridia bacterium]